MRLTLINQFYTPDISPTAHLCASLAEHRAAHGDQVTVLTSRAGYLTAVRVEEATGGVRVRRLWSTGFGSRSKIGRLIDWLSFYGPAIYVAMTLPRQDVIIAMTTPPFIAIAGWLHKLIHPSARLVLWSMDVYPEALERTKLVKVGGIVSQVMRATHRAIFNRLDLLVCLDPAMEKLLLSQYAPVDRPLAHAIVPNWERLELFPKDQIHQPWRGPVVDSLAGQFVVLYLGNAGFGHEFQTLIDAAELLRDQPARFLFVGGGALRPWIAQECGRRKLKNIILHDYVPKEQTPSVMCRADAALITLENSMLGVMSPSKLHANLAMNLPIIYVGPKQGNVDHAIARFSCGVSLRTGDAAGLADFVKEMIADPARHALLRERARAAFDETYCDARALASFDQLITSVQSDTGTTAHFRRSL